MPDGHGSHYRGHGSRYRGPIPWYAWCRALPTTPEFTPEYAEFPESPPPPAVPEHQRIVRPHAASPRTHPNVLRVFRARGPARIVGTAVRYRGTRGVGPCPPRRSSRRSPPSSRNPRPRLPSRNTNESCGPTPRHLAPIRTCFACSGHAVLHGTDSRDWPDSRRAPWRVLETSVNPREPGKPDEREPENARRQWIGRPGAWKTRAPGRKNLTWKPLALDRTGTVPVQPRFRGRETPGKV